MCLIIHIRICISGTDIFTGGHRLTSVSAMLVSTTQLSMMKRFARLTTRGNKKEKGHHKSGGIGKRNAALSAGGGGTVATTSSGEVATTGRSTATNVVVRRKKSLTKSPSRVSLKLLRGKTSIPVSPEIETEVASFQQITPIEDQELRHFIEEESPYQNSVTGSIAKVTKQTKLQHCKYKMYILGLSILFVAKNYPPKCRGTRQIWHGL